LLSHINHALGSVSLDACRPRLQPMLRVGGIKLALAEVPSANA
jgi:hypothetical protein